MMKSKYYFNEKKLKYEKITFKISDFFYYYSFVLIMFFTLSFLFITIYQYFFDLPKDIKLKNYISKLEYNYDIFNNKINSLDQSLNELSERDNNIYKSIFSINIDDNNNYKTINSLNFNKTDNCIENIQFKLNILDQKIKTQSKSYFDISKTIELKKNMIDSIPSIQPISNKNLKRIASGFGWRIHPIYKISKMHYGIDFSAPIGTKIYATGNGIIKDVNITRSYGLSISINHGYGYKTLYAHLSKSFVKKNQFVNRGDIIGLVGNSGISTGSHLHYEVYKNNKPIDPALFFFNDISPDQYDEMIKLSKKIPISFD